ncbi:MAG: glycosyltransferase family 4 protein [Desulfomonilaceae bacterium]|nr:glycosyltransferase family 4 protein [Desulfomonilaceae bacterium]
MMRRILVVGPVPPPFGGIASLMDDIIKSDLANEYVFDIFPRSAGFPSEAHGAIGRNLYRIRRFLTFFRQVRTKAYDLVHLHSADPVFLGTALFMALARLAGVRVLLHMHGTDWGGFYAEASAFRKLYTRLGLMLPAHIVVLYGLWEQKIRELLPRTDVRIVSNFIRGSSPPNRAEVQKTRRDLGLEDDDFLVLTTGAVGWRKGSFEIVRAASRVAAEDDTIRFVLVGGEEEDGEMGMVLDRIEKEHVRGRVTLTGEVERDRIPCFLAAADVFLLPSFIEGMPISILEAMEAGLPVISTKVNAIPYMIEDGVSGLLIDPGSPDQIARAVLRLKQDAGLYEKLANGSRQAFNEKFEYSIGIGHMRTLFENILGKDDQ